MSEPLRCVCESFQGPFRSSGGVDGWDYIFHFEAVPKSAHGTVREPAHTFHFAVRLQVSGTLLACGTWPETNPIQRRAFLFQAVVDSLNLQAAAPKKDETITIPLNTYTPLGKKLQMGPEKVYALDKIDQEAAFEVTPSDEQKETIGFRT